MLDWEPDAADPAQFLESLRCDLAEGQIQVFSDGRQVVLPAGATPVDLAYELGNDRGDHCLAATHQRSAGPARSELDEGDVVEIFTETDGDNGFEAGWRRAGPAGSG